jgi:DnaK suppressor protein
MATKENLAMTTHLNTRQRALLEAALSRRKHELEQQIAQHLGGDSRSDHAREVLLQDGDDAPARDADREVDLARSDQDIGELRAVNAALTRLRGSEYGLCGDCGTEIPFERLRHSPQAPRCVACQSAFESHRSPTPRATI